jgi:uncharacterized RDD family membrane protein YckC
MTTITPSDSAPGLFRRLAVLVYDALVMLAVLFLATAVALPVTHGEAVAAENPLFQLYLLAVMFLYLGWFWTHAGQTVAMRAWRLRVVDLDGRAIGWGQALKRFVAALLPMLPGLVWLGVSEERDNRMVLMAIMLPWLAGFLWLVLDRQKRTLHDILSATRMVQYAPPAIPGKS